MTPRLLVIVGPTASGKTALAIQAAEQFDGEIICADSRTIYRGMDVGTAKPTQEERQRVPHFGLDLVEPGTRYTVADFQRYSREKIREIQQRGKLPIVVGGTGLYVDAVVYEYEFGKGDAGGQDNNCCNKNNKSHKQGASSLAQKTIGPISTVTCVKSKHDQNGKTIIVGLATKKHILAKRIALRAEQIFSNKVVEEATYIGNTYGWESAAMTGNVYPIVRQYDQGTLALEAATELLCVRDRQLAKRQMTWFRANPDIVWCESKEAMQLIAHLL